MTEANRGGAADAGMPEEIPENDIPVQPLDFAVVGIGASAGGLEALQHFFDQMPADSGMAFVVVVHLHPEYASHLPELLQKHTAMPVTQVSQTVGIEPNHVYVIPPNRNISSIDTHLRLSELEARERRAPIDHFLRTLAETHGDQAIGIILSGTGSDGATGLRHIKEYGGLTVAQEPPDASYDGMPQSAIATGQVDLVLPVAAIPAKLLDFRQSQPRVDVPGDGEALANGGDEALQSVLIYLRAHTDHDFTAYKVNTLMRRLRHRMQIIPMDEVSDYVKLLRQDGHEAEALLKDLLITVTNFFRDSEAFTLLEQAVVPALFRGKGANDQVRVWVVGCATGEEAYSLAMLLMEQASRVRQPPAIQIFATDISQEALARAKEGFYPEAISANITPERLERFFTKEKDGYRVRPEVRQLVLFAAHNLLKDPPFSRQDLISCRNLLIYLKREMQRQLFDLFHYTLRTDGYLFLGSSESVDGKELFQEVDRKQSLYQRRSLPHRQPRLPEMPFGQPEISEERPSLGFAAKPMGDGGHAGTLHYRMVEQVAPPSALVNADYELVHLSESAGRFLRWPGGQPSNNILRGVRNELRPELTAALYSAFEEGRTSRSLPITLQLEGESRQVSLHVRPGTSQELEGLALVMFEEGEASKAGPAEDQDAGRRFEDQLEQTRHRLQGAIAEFENSKGQMRAANEELLSMNEELRSAAEELETSKEELQSMNEELMTVNQENRNRMEELNHLNGDLQNLLQATNIATIFLDRQLQIRRITPEAEVLFNVRPSDRGRPLAHLTHRLGYDGLVDEANQALRTLVTVEREITSQDGRWFLTRLVPYRTVDDHIDGIVITLVDITMMKEAEELLRQSEKRLASLNEDLENRVTARTAQVRQLAAEVLFTEQKAQQELSLLLHDDLQQRLFSTQMQLQTLTQALAAGQQPEPSDVQEVEAMLDEAIAITRDVARDLAPPVLSKPDFMESLRWLVTSKKEKYGLEVRLAGKMRPDVLAKEVRASLFRILRELLFNVVKHSGVDQATLKVAEKDKRLVIEVSDKGKGFDVASLAANSETTGGSGLTNIRERLELFGGRLEIDSEPGQGTRATVTIPLKMISLRQ